MEMIFVAEEIPDVESFIYLELLEFLACWCQNTHNVKQTGIYCELSGVIIEG